MNRFLKHAWVTAKQVVGNEHGWIPLVVAGISAAATAYAASKSSAATSGGEDAEILPNTVSGNTYQDQDFVFDQEASEAMKGLTDMMGEWSQTDRDFFEKTFQPFQQSLIEGNKALIPNIVANSKESLAQNMSDLVASDHLKDQFRATMSEAGEGVVQAGRSFFKQIQDIPSAEQRVGEAVAGIEKRFGQAGAELKRSMASKGLDVDVASQRALSIAKASAKAGATDQAQEAARLEKMTATEKGIGIASTVQQSNAQMLGAERGLTQAGADLTPQIGGVQETGAVSDAGKIEADMTTTAAEKVLGTKSTKQTAEFTQAGVVEPRFFDRETGKMVDGAGNEIKKPRRTTGGTYDPVRTLVTSGRQGRGIRVGRGGTYGVVDRYFDGAGDDGGAPGDAGGHGVGAPGAGLACFPAGTKIALPNGERSDIEDVRIGDKVIAYNINKAHIVCDEVNELKTVKRTGYFILGFQSDRTLRLTDDHPLYTPNGWASINPNKSKESYRGFEIDQLVPGRYVKNIDGAWDAILNITWVSGDIITYTIGGISSGNFFADGYLASITT